MRYSVTLLLILFICTCVRAQINNFQPATLVLTDGAELSGWVSAENNAELAKGIRFRREKTDRNSEQNYSPRQLKHLKFSETGQFYRSIPYTFTPVGDSLVRNEFRIAELLYDGVYDLYTFDRGVGEFFDKGKVISPRTYYLVDGESATALEKIQRPANLQNFPNKKSKIVFNIIEAWRGKLTYYFRDWPEAESQIKKIRYTDNELIRIFDAYTQFKDPAAAKTDLGAIRDPLGTMVRLNAGSKTRVLNNIEGADMPTFGLGLYFNKSPKGWLL